MNVNGESSKCKLKSQKRSAVQAERRGMRRVKVSKPSNGVCVPLDFSVQRAPSDLHFLPIPLSKTHADARKDVLNRRCHVPSRDQHIFHPYFYQEKNVLRIFYVHMCRVEVLYLKYKKTNMYTHKYI